MALVDSWQPLEKQFAIGLAVILLGYLFLGRGFAYFHISVGTNVYVGEIVLGLGLLVGLLRLQVFPGAFHSTPSILLVFFLLLGLLHTSRDFGAHGVLAIRDSAICYYAIFALLLFEFVRTRKRLEKIISIYARIGGIFIWWAPLAASLMYFAGNIMPNAPGTDVPALNLRPGELVVHLTSIIALFMLLDKATTFKLPHRNTLWYAGALISAVLSSGRGRAALLTILCGLSVAIALGREGKTWRLITAVFLLSSVFILADPQVNLPSGRVFSTDTLSGEFNSVFTSNDAPGFRQNTKYWRLNWWSKIVEETFAGPHFWEGRGFGVNLADAHGFQVHGFAVKNRLRSPHSAHMTILARMGVPGFILWVLVHASLVLRFYSSWLRARQAGDRFLQGVLAWVLCYWVAAVVNSSFDVYFEGPQGAIWFWSVMGIGLAAAQLRPCARENEPVGT